MGLDETTGILYKYLSPASPPPYGLQDFQPLQQRHVISEK